MAHTTLKLGIYRHYKGNKYKVICQGTHTETHEELVVYQSYNSVYEAWDSGLWIRPLKMFLGKVTFKGEKVLRFRYVCTKKGG